MQSYCRPGIFGSLATPANSRRRKGSATWRESRLSKQLSVPFRSSRGTAAARSWLSASTRLRAGNDRQPIGAIRQLAQGAAKQPESTLILRRTLRRFAGNTQGDDDRLWILPLTARLYQTAAHLLAP